MVSEVALAVVLLVAPALLIRTSLALGAVKPGFDAENVLTMRMSLDGPQFAKSAAVEQLVRDGVERLRAHSRRGAGERHLLRAARRRLRTAVHDHGPAAHRTGRFTAAAAGIPISPGYFEVFKIPVMRGRAFTERDNARRAAGGDHQSGDGEAVLAEGRSAERQDLDRQGRDGANWRPKSRGRSSAIVGDIRDDGLNRDPGPTMYIPQAQVPDAAQCAECPADADGVDRADAQAIRCACRAADSGAAAAGERPAGVGCPHHGRGGLAIDVAAAVQYAADDGLRRAPR